jgi:16S rRNA processing protein RimM
MLLIGEIVASFGVRGQVKMRSYTDYVEHFRRKIRTIYLGPNRQAYTITAMFEHKPGLLILTLDGVTTREAADGLRGSDVTIPEQQAAPLAEGEYFLHQLYGLTVITDEGEELGTVREVLTTGANDVLVVPRHGKPDALIPMIHDVVRTLDFTNSRIVVHLIEGLLP